MSTMRKTVKVVSAVVTPPKFGTKEHADWCEYMASVCLSPANQHKWERRAEESRMLSECRNTNFSLR